MMCFICRKMCRSPQSLRDTLAMTSTMQAFSHVAADRQYEAGKGATRVKHDSSGGKAAAGQGLLLFEPPSVPTAVSGRHEGPAGEDEMELLLDGHVRLVLTGMIAYIFLGLGAIEVINDLY